MSGMDIEKAEGNMKDRDHPGEHHSSRNLTLTGSTDHHPFFRYYAQLSHQQNMLQDYVRTGIYYQAVFENRIDFKDKVVMDVGTGSGILALFAAKAGARKVYAVEASSVAQYAKQLVEANGFQNVIQVIHKKVEDLNEEDISEPVDLIISEPMGFMLVHERMLESFIYAGQRFLQPRCPEKGQRGGKMFPSTGTMFFLPFSDQNLYNEYASKSDFWNTQSFYGVSLTSLREASDTESFGQVDVGTADLNVVISDVQRPARFVIDFEHNCIDDLKKIHVPFEFEITVTSVLHGILGWFDVDFRGSTSVVTLSTSPRCRTTHWYQCRFVLKKPIAVNVGQRIKGYLEFSANEYFSYDVDIYVKLLGLSPSESVVIETRNHIKLQDQHFSAMYSNNVPQCIIEPSVAEMYSSTAQSKERVEGSLNAV